MGLQVFHAHGIKPDAPFPLVDDFDAFIIGPTPIFANDVESRKPREQVVEECREREPEMRGLAKLLIDNFLNMVGCPRADSFTSLPPIRGSVRFKREIKRVPIPPWLPSPHEILRLDKGL